MTSSTWIFFGSMALTSKPDGVRGLRSVFSSVGGGRLQLTQSWKEFARRLATPSDIFTIYEGNAHRIGLFPAEAAKRPSPTMGD